MGTDFFDDDLTQKDSRRSLPSSDIDMVSVRPMAETNAGRMAKQKEELSTHLVTATKEMEQLRIRQEELEKERNRLHELSRKQEEYLRDKQDIIEKMDRGVITVEKEEVEATRMAQLLSETRTKFKAALAELRGINEDAWAPGDERFEEELNKAMAVVENARMDYKKALSRIDASSWHRAGGAAEPGTLLDSVGTGTPGGFLHWFKIGLAVTLPLIGVLALLFIASLMMKRPGGF